MTAVEIYMAQENIILKKFDECKERLQSIPEKNANERRTLQIKIRTYLGCLHIGLLCATRKPGHAERALDARGKIISDVLVHYPRINKIFTSLEGEEKEIFIAAVQGELYIRNKLYGAYVSEYEGAKASEDTEKASELSIQIEATEDIFEAFESWRKENGIYPRIFE